MGGRGAGSASGTLSQKISKAATDLDKSKLGKTFNRLPQNFQNNINENLKMSKSMQDSVSGKIPGKISDQWVTGLSDAKDKAKVITNFDGKEISYTVKYGRKIAQKNATKEQAANRIAEFYAKQLKLAGY